MRNNPFRASTVGERCDSLDGRVAYANKQIKNPDEATQGRLLVAGVLSAVSRVLKAHASDIGTVFTPSIESGRAAQERSQSALDICEELLNVGDAQISAALTSLPTFTLPSKRSGGAAMSLGGNNDEDLSAAFETVAREADVLKAFVQQTTPFTAGTRVAAFVDALLASDISESSKVDGAVSNAFSVAEKIPAPPRDEDEDDDRFDGGAISL